MAWSVLQAVTGTVVASGNATVTPTSNLSAGSKLIAVTSVDESTNTEVTSVRDAALNDFTLIATMPIPAGGGQARLGVWILDTPAGDVGAKPVITAVMPTNFGADIGLIEVAGLVPGNTSAVLDVAAALANGTASPATGGSYTTSVANEFLLVAAGDAGYNTTYTLTGYTTALNSGASSSDQLVAGYKNSTGAAETFSWAISGATTWGSLIMAFKVAAPAAPVPLLQPGGQTWRRQFRRPQVPIRNEGVTLPPPPPLPAAPLQEGGLIWRRQWRIPQARWDRFAQPPYITGLAGGGNGYFVDQFGTPRMVWGDAVWGLCGNAGRWNSGNWQADYDTYLANRAGQGFTAVYTKPMGTVQNLGINNDGRVFDGLFPFQGGSFANPSTGLTEAFWARIDYFLSSAKAKGIAVFLNAVGYASDFVAGGSGPLANKSSAEFQSYGTALGSRYKSQDNLIWMVADDYFGGSDDTMLSSFLTGLRAGGANQVISIENMPESTARWTLDASQTALAWGTSNAQFNTVYSYDQEYLGVERAYAESSPVPVIQLDGYFYQGNSVYNGGATYDRAFRQAAWWSLAAGARGKVHGSESMWQYQSTALAASSTDWFYANGAGPIRTAVEALPGWQLLIPDVGSGFITAGRGTRASAFASGGGGGQYEPAFTSSYVAASLTPTGTLALLYIPNATTITINEAKLGGAGAYTATWIDPVTGATSVATPGTTYNTTAKGNNSRGEPDWVLALQGTGTSLVKSAGGMAVGMGTGQAARAVRNLTAGAMAVGAGTGTRVAIRTRPAAGMAVGMGTGPRTVMLPRAAPGMAVGAGTGTVVKVTGATTYNLAAGGMAVGDGTGPRTLTLPRATPGMAVGDGTGLRTATRTRNAPGMAVGDGTGARTAVLPRNAPGMAVGMATGPRVAVLPRAAAAMAVGDGIGTRTATRPRATGGMAVGMGQAARTLTLPRSALAMAVGMGTGTGVRVSLNKAAGGMAVGAGTAVRVLVLPRNAGAMIAGAGIGTVARVSLAKLGGGMAVGAGVSVHTLTLLCPGGAMAVGAGNAVRVIAFTRKAPAMTVGAGTSTVTVTHAKVYSLAAGGMGACTATGTRTRSRNLAGGAMSCTAGTGVNGTRRTYVKTGGAMSGCAGIGARPPSRPYPGALSAGAPHNEWGAGPPEGSGYATGAPHGVWAAGAPHE